MIARAFRSLGAACLVTVLFAPANAGTRGTTSPSFRAARPASAAIVDFSRRLDVNRMSLVVTNLGWLGLEPDLFNAGLWYPRDSSSTMLFASGPWLGAMVGGAPRVTVAEFSSEFLPGTMVGGGPGVPNAPENRVWKVRRWTGDPQDSAHVERAPGGVAVDALVHDSWAEYVAAAVPNGAPWRLHRLPDTSTPDPADSVDVPGPDVLGDLMTWCVFNDADPAPHVSIAGGTAPLGAEVEQVVFGLDDPGPLGDVAFVRWRVRNRGASAWTDCRAGYWLDAEVGTSYDDKVGCDSTRSLGYAYNAVPFDGIYGDHPPALGAVLLGGPPASAMHAFIGYLNGTDPASAVESYRLLSGLNPDGSPMLGVDGSPTRYQYSGDPLLGTGWLNPFATDQRFMASLAPRDVAPGDSLELWAALVVGPGADRGAALAAMTCRADHARNAFDSGLARPLPTAPECEAPRNCPRAADYWEGQCGGGGSYAAPDLAALAALVDSGSVTFDFGGDPLAGLCAELAPGGDVRQQARREYAAFLANVWAGRGGLHPGGELPVLLMSTTAVDCPDASAVDVGQLAATAGDVRLISGTYQNLVTTNPRALEGVDAGMSGFAGGAGAAIDFLGSSLDPSAQPDSFPRLVRVAFDHAQTQLAYRYLRLEQADGSEPTSGREYRFAGFRSVPFVVRDADTGEQLDAAFVERAITDLAGTLQPPAAQPASFDSTWGPTLDALGDREYLFVSRRPYTGTPRSEFAVDGGCADTGLPWLFALWSRLRLFGVTIDDGDAFEFGFDYAITPGVDDLLRDLEGRPLSDPDVATAYQQIADCLGALNRAETVGPVCDEPTPALVSLVSAEAEPGLVRVEWLVADPAPVSVERSGEGVEWAEVLATRPDGSGRVVLADRDVEPGGRYSYRLRLASGVAGEVTIEVPSHHRLSLAGFRPNPATGPLAVAFTLSSSAPARLEVLDVSGRRVYAQAVERPAPGQRVLALPGLRLAPGVYVLRLEQGATRLVARSVVIR